MREENGSQSLDGFLKTCRDTDQLPDLWHHALEFFYERGIRMASYHSDESETLTKLPSRVVTDGFPAAWVCQYLETNLCLVDPIPEIAAISARPFRWSEAGSLATLTRKGEAYLETLFQSGLGDGLAMQVHGPGLRNAYVGFGFGGNDPGLSEADVLELRAAAQIAHLRYCELTDDNKPVRDMLTSREREVLRWIARGKSNSVIAEILEVSPHTVDTLTRRIFEKLGVADRTTAAIRGVGAGLVRYKHGDIL
jgi:LuxR family transcriptional regulator/LuxR family quorum-sensing system transcriptional regulator CciR